MRVALAGRSQEVRQGMRLDEASQGASRRSQPAGQWRPGYSCMADPASQTSQAQATQGPDPAQIWVTSLPCAVAAWPAVVSGSPVACLTAALLSSLMQEQPSSPASLTQRSPRLLPRNASPGVEQRTANHRAWSPSLVRCCR
jgi:hypothetical protein